MRRKIVEINEEKCNGCGACASACHEGAIAMIDGKARLIKDDYCDGLGDCLPACPTDAISIIEREAAQYDAEAVEARMKQAKHSKQPVQTKQSELSQQPVQIKLVPVNAPYFDGAKLLVAADCTAFAYGDFHRDFIRDHITLVGCPKLDEGDYSEKLTEIIKNNDIKSAKIVRMEVPCCGGIENAVKKAIAASGKMLPWQVVTIGCDGRIVDES